MNRDQAYRLITAERERQAAMWGRDHAWGHGDCSAPLHPAVKVAVLTEELGEVARAVLEHDPDQLLTELVQLAAVAVAWIEGLTE